MDGSVSAGWKRIRRANTLGERKARVRFREQPEATVRIYDHEYLLEIHIGDAPMIKQCTVG